MVAASCVTRSERRKNYVVSFSWDTGGKGTQVLSLTERMALKRFLKNRMRECGLA
jgi:hypothetical protein